MNRSESGLRGGQATLRKYGMAYFRELSAAAAQAKLDKTHCKHGHPLSGENLYVHTFKGRTYRACKECNRIHAREIRRKQRESA